VPARFQQGDQGDRAARNSQKPPAAHARAVTYEEGSAGALTLPFMPQNGDSRLAIALHLREVSLDDDESTIERTLGELERRSIWTESHHPGVEAAEAQVVSAPDRDVRKCTV
jgi:hypothetical protein